MNSKKMKIYYGISYTIFACLFITFICFINQRIDYLLNSDISSEMILAEIVANSGQLLNHDWFYSTEIRLFYIQLIASPLFYLTSNWHIIRVITIVIVVGIFLASVFFFMYSINQHKYFPIIASFLILPLSTKYYEYIIYALYYTPNMILTLNILALSFISIKSENKKKQGLFIVLALILSLIAGLCGIRNLINIFAPIGITSFVVFLLNLKSENFNTCKKFFISMIFVCAIGCIGVLINHFYLSESFGFSNYGYMDNLMTIFNINGLRNALYGLFYVLGLISEYNIYLEILLIVLLIALFVFAFKKSSNLSLAEKSVSIYLLTSICIYIGIYTFTNMTFMTAYLVPTSIFTLFVITAVFKNLIKNGVKKSIIVSSLCAISLTSVTLSAINYSTLWKIDNTYAHRQVVEQLIDNECYEGYTTFWNGNVLTELSNGKVKVRHISYSADDTNIDTGYYWLQQKSLIERKPEGKVFILFTTGEYESYALADFFTDETYLVDNNDDYKLFIFDSYDEMIRITGVGHNFS